MSLLRMRAAAVSAGASGVAVAVALGTVLAGGLVLVTATPASAATAVIAISAPSPGTPFTSGPGPIAGQAHIGAALLEQNYLTGVNVAVTSGGSQAGSCDNGGCGASVGVGVASTNFSFTPPLTRNGPYSATATVTASECGALGCAARSNTATTNFTLAVPPVAPRNVRARVNTDGSVTVSWDANPEPDVAGYQIRRRDGGAPPRTVKVFLQQTSWTDPGTAQSGGQFGYIVYAVRPGADGTANTAIATPSAVASADVPVPIPVTTVPTGVVGSIPATTTTAPPASGGAGGGLDLSGFLAQATKAGAIPATAAKAAVHSSPPPRVVLPSASALGPPDTYAPTLPFGVSPKAVAGGGAGVPQVPLPGRPAPSHQHRSLLYSVAGGLLLCVLGFAVRTANKRPTPAPLEPLGDGVGEGPQRALLTAGAASFAAKAAAKAAARTLALAAALAARADRPEPSPLTAVDPELEPADASHDDASSAPPPLPPRAPLPPLPVSPSSSPPVERVARAARAARMPRTPRVSPVRAPRAPRAPRVPLSSSPLPRVEGAASHPGVEDAVDYFRLVRTDPESTGESQDPAPVEVAAPAG